MTLTEALQAEALDRTYLRPDPDVDPLGEVIGILARLLKTENTRIRSEAAALGRRRINDRKDHR